MDAKGDLEKYLTGHIKARRLPRGTNHDRWGIGNDILEVPDNITGRRTYLNYKGDAKRKAIAQGLLPPRPKPPPESLLGAERRRRHKHLKQAKRDQPSAEEGTAKDVEAWRQRQLLNELARKLRFIKEARIGGPMRICVSFRERVGKIKAAIIEAGKPLNHEEIYRAVGCSKPYDEEAIRRTLNKAVPEHFRVVPTERKRYPKFDLASNVLRPVGPGGIRMAESEVGAAKAAEVGAAGSGAASEPASVSSAEAFAAGGGVEKDVTCPCALLEEIGKIAEDARSRDAERAFFALGKIAGLAEGWQRLASKPAK